MPRKSSGAHLWLRPERRGPNGKLRERASYLIKDRGRQIATGCLEGEAEAAELRLSEYIQSRLRPARSEKDIESIFLCDVLSIYYDDKKDKQARPKKLKERIDRLNDWWGDKLLSSVTGETCRAYAKNRGNTGGARRDLEDLRAAINHHSKQGLHRGTVKVWLPQKGEPRDRWLTRDEAAALLWACWRYREIQTRHRGVDSGRALPTKKFPLRHIARFILLGLYTGSRAGAIASASPYRAEGRSYVDLERGIFYRLATGKRATSKRQPPVPLPGHLIAHMRRWRDKKVAAAHFVEWQGKPVLSVKNGFARGVKLAGLSGKVTPHTLRHTAATWLMQSGVDVWEAAGFLGMSPQMVERVYGHHHPDHLKSAVAAMSKGRRKAS